MKTLIRIGIFLLTVFATTSVGAQIDSLALNYGQTIKSEELRKHLTILASDEFEGRETGRKGQKLASRYIADYFVSIGIPALPEIGYQLPFPVQLKFPEGIEITAADSTFEFLKDFYYFRGFSDTNFTVNQAVFAGYGITDDAINDYDGIDVTEKVVFMYEGEPVRKGKSVITGTEEMSGWTTQWRNKLMLAQQKGAAAVFIVVDDIKTNLFKLKYYIQKPSMSLVKEESGNGMPVIYVSEDMFLYLIDEKQRFIKKTRRKLSKGKNVSEEILCQVTVNMNRKKEMLESDNVLGYIEGSDDALKNEVVVITAHYDHLGISGEDIYNGADDDGSGTTALLEIADAFQRAKKQGKGPQRSVLIMAVSGEEKGLLGSEYYTSNPVFPLENTVCNLNVDMIGRQDIEHADNPNYIYLIGSDKLSTDLHEISEHANRTYTNLELDYTYNDPNDPNRFYYRSDHYNFAKNNIPVIFYFNGTHEDYHKPTDTVDKINFDKMEKITRLVFYTAWDVANRTERIKVDKQPEKNQ